MLQADRLTYLRWRSFKEFNDVAIRQKVKCDAYSFKTKTLTRTRPGS